MSQLRVAKHIPECTALRKVCRRGTQRVGQVGGPHAAAGRRDAVEVGVVAGERVLRRTAVNGGGGDGELFDGQVLIRHEHCRHLAGDFASNEGRGGQQGCGQRCGEGGHRESTGRGVYWTGC